MLKKFTALLLCLCLLLTALPAFAETTAAESPAPTIRVLLKRPGIRDSVTLLLGCTYTVKPASGSLFVLPSGTEVTVQAVNGELYFHYESMNLCAGACIEMTRSAVNEGETASAFSGLQLSAGGYIYPGDLKLTLSGGYVQAVLTLSVEDYLLGVLPYEMNDNYPIEALKAQAVCARTYALSHVDPTRDWDVMDTTDSQVFAGVNSFNSNCENAVKATAGIVGTVNGALASCYYTASNGGQTELPQNIWGESAAQDCYALIDDPYDLENPESVVHQLTLSKYGVNIPEALLAALEETDIIEIDAIEPAGQTGDNRYAPELTFTYINKESETKSKTVNLFTTGLMDTLGLSVDSTEREMLTVADNGNSFVIESRRFGHGVGMSQRGAQQMAEKYGKNYQEILAFYYPGMELMLAPSGKTTLPTVPAALAATPGPTATPTPRPTLMPVTTPEAPEAGWLASVEGIDDDSSLNLRDKPAGDGAILMRLYKHQQLWVLEQVDDSWVHVKTDSIEGYVMAKFLEKVE